MRRGRQKVSANPAPRAKLPVGPARYFWIIHRGEERTVGGEVGRRGLDWEDEEM